MAADEGIQLPHYYELRGTDCSQRCYESGTVEHAEHNDFMFRLGRDNPKRRHSALVEALCGSVDNEHLFHTSAAFKANVEYLASILPVWVNAMATSAALQDEQARLMMVAAMEPLTMVERNAMIRRIEGELRG